MKIDHTYDIVDDFPMENQSLTDIINLKQLHNLFNVVLLESKDLGHFVKKIYKTLYQCMILCSLRDQ